MTGMKWSALPVNISLGKCKVYRFSQNINGDFPVSKDSESILYTNVDPIETDRVRGYFIQETLKLIIFLNKQRNIPLSCFVYDNSFARHNESIRNDK